MQKRRIKFSFLLISLICLPTVLWAQFTGGKSEIATTTIKEFREDFDLSESDGILDLVKTAEKADEKEYIINYPEAKPSRY